jgi:hypothetical protein
VKLLAERWPEKYPAGAAEGLAVGEDEDEDGLGKMAGSVLPAGCSDIELPTS